MNRIILIITAIFLFGCGGQKKENKKNPKKNETTTTDDDWLTDIFLEPSERTENVARVKLLRKKIMLLKAKGKSDCKQRTQVHKDPLLTDSPDYMHAARTCELEDGFRFDVLIQKGYGWKNKTVFLYQNDVPIFMHSFGGPETWPYDRRIYFDEEGNAISILENTDVLDDREVSHLSEEKGSDRGRRILKELDDLHDDFDKIMGD